MSSRREVLIRIPALLQRKTLIETKNRTLKWHYWTVRSIKNVALLTEDGAFALFFRPHHGGFASSRVATPGNLPSKAKKMLIPGGQPGGGRGGLGAGGIDWCIKHIYFDVSNNYDCGITGTHNVLLDPFLTIFHITDRELKPGLWSVCLFLPKIWTLTWNSSETLTQE